MTNRILDYLNGSPTIFFILKKDDGLWELEYVTDNVINIYGKTSEDFLKKKYHHADFIHKVDLKRFNEEASLISKIEGNAFTYSPYRIVAGDVTYWINHTTKIIRDENGKPSFYYGYITDITEQKNSNDRLNDLNTVLDSIFNNSFNLILLLDNRGKLIKANRTSLEIVGYKEEDVLNSYFWDLPWWNYCNQEQKNVLIEEISIIKTGSSLKNNKFYYDTTGQKIEVDFCFSPVFDSDLNVTHILCEAHDITESKNIQKSLEQYMKIVNDNVYITISDLTGKIINVSDAYCKLTGYLRDELIDKNHSIFRHPDTEDYIFKELWATINKGRLWKGEHKNIKKDGTAYWVENSITPNLDDDKNITGFTSIYNDITDKKEISELLITDYLTKIYNRRHFNDIFELELKRAKRDKENLILMILDIDYFKQYNDTYGHDAGDKALQLVANSLKYTLNRAHDFVFRLGGEEFGIITSKIGVDGVIVLSQKLKESIENLEIVHKGNNVSDFITISIGTKIVSCDTTLNQNDIYKLADQALYEAKDSGRNKAVISTRSNLS